MAVIGGCTTTCHFERERFGELHMFRFLSGWILTPVGGEIQGQNLVPNLPRKLGRVQREERRGKGARGEKSEARGQQPNGDGWIGGLLDGWIGGLLRIFGGRKERPRGVCAMFRKILGTGGTEGILLKRYPRVAVRALSYCDWHRFAEPQRSATGAD